MFKKNMERMKTFRKNPKLLLALYDHVHPDLSVNTCAIYFQCVIKFFPYKPLTGL